MARQNKTVSQAAVIAMRQGQICLITSRSGKRWLLPKGHLELGEDLRDTARQEAWEEAGLLGRLVGRPVGRYRFQKMGRSHCVCVFQMEVTKVKRDWPERKQRRRLWIRPEEAVDWVDNGPLRAIIDSLVSRKAA